MEEAFFQRDYAQQPIEERLTRLENLVFGEPKQGGLAERQAQILKTALINKLSLTPQPLPDELGPEVPYNDPSLQSEQDPNLAEIPQEPDATDYPSVTALEMKLFQTSYAKENIQQRLARLEQQVFKQTYPDRPFASRVDQLTIRIVPDSPLAQEQQWRSQFASRLPQTGQQFTSQNFAIYAQLSAVEMQVFQKNYSGETLTNRIGRLEANLFSAAQPGTIDERFDNIISNYNSVLRNRQLGQPNTMAGPANNTAPPAWQQTQPFVPQAPQLPQFPINTPVANAPSGDLLSKLAQMEMAVFGKVYSTVDINNRITNLEIKVLRTPQPLNPVALRIQALDQRLRGPQ